MLLKLWVIISIIIEFYCGRYLKYADGTPSTPQNTGQLYAISDWAVVVDVLVCGLGEYLVHMVAIKSFSMSIIFDKIRKF